VATTLRAHIPRILGACFAIALLIAIVLGSVACGKTEAAQRNGNGVSPAPAVQSVPVKTENTSAISKTNQGHTITNTASQNTQVTTSNDQTWTAPDTGYFFSPRKVYTWPKDRIAGDNKFRGQKRDGNEVLAAYIYKSNKQVAPLESLLAGPGGGYFTSTHEYSIKDRIGGEMQLLVIEGPESSPKIIITRTDGITIVLSPIPMKISTADKWGWVIDPHWDAYTLVAKRGQ